MQVLVTGGAGFIGSHVCVELLGAGHDVILIDNFSNAKREIPARIEQIAGRPLTLHEADLRDRAAVRRIFSENAIDAVIHCAGLKSVPDSIQRPLSYYENNLESTFALCDAMQRSNCRRIIFSSSATVYGLDNPVPFREEMPVSAAHPYGASKVMIERILSDLAVADPRSWSIVLLRYFNPVGAHPSGLIGEDPNGIANNLMPCVAQVAGGTRSEVLVYGDDYQTPDGTGIRDYIHVVDLAEGHLRALEYALHHPGVETINLGAGCGTSVLELIDAYGRACGRRIPYRIVPRRPGDIAVCYAQTDKARGLLGWAASRGIDEMCEDSWRFAKKLYS